jgi:hypothetical protein
MSKKLFVTIEVTLPDDLFAASGIYAHILPAWTGLKEALADSGAAYDVKMQELEQRTRAARKPRKPRLVATGDAA